MKSILRASLVLLVLATACKPKSTQDDSLYQFKDYLAYHTQGIRSIHDPIVVDLLAPINGYELNQELSSKSFKISPSIDGSLILKDQRSLVFTPSEPLKSDTEYSVTVSLSDFIDDLPKDKRSFTFSFKTLTANFKLDLGQLQSYSKEYQYLHGTVQSADGIFLDQAKGLVEATQNGNALPIKWDSIAGPNTYYVFVIDSIFRAEDDSKILISWNGRGIGSDNNGDDEYGIPGRNNFKVLDVTTTAAPSTQLSINFSDPVDPNQNFQGLVNLGNSDDLRFEADGNTLLVYPTTRPQGDLDLTVFEGLKNTDGYTLKASFNEVVSFDPLKPQLRLLSKGTIIPNAKNNPIYFEAVNLSQVDVRVVEVFQNNMLQFLQDTQLDNTDEYYLRRVGRRVAKKTITLVDTNFVSSNSWKAHALDLSDLFQANPGSAYRVEFSFKPSYSLYPCDETVLADSEEDYYEEDYYYDDYEEAYNEMSEADEDELEARYWDNEVYRWRRFTYNWEQQDNPCHDAYYSRDRLVQTNVLASDLGLTIKKGNNGTYHIYTSDLISSKPMGGVKVSLYNYQQQELYQLTTDNQGQTIFDAEKTAAFVIANKGSNYAYARLEDGDALSLSKFDVAGGRVQKGLKGFLYTERGVHRPGDSIHLTFVLNDEANPLPEDHPVKLEVTDARGKLVKRQVVRGGVNGFYYFPIATSAESPTGNWNATVKVGGASFGKTLRVATIKPNRLKIILDFEDEVLEATEPIVGSLQSNWLHGAPARNLDVSMDLTISEASAPFKDYAKYDFSDPSAVFTPQNSSLPKPA